MYLLYNGQLLPENELRMPLANRAFQYGDGFFETMIMVNGVVRFWKDHLNRVQEAAAILQVQLPTLFFEDQFIGLIQNLAFKNECGNLVRLKWKIWRSGAGLYTPQIDQVDWLIIAEKASKNIASTLELKTCTSTYTYHSPFSSFKGIHAPVYVLASREKVQRKAEDLLLLDAQEHVAELTSSNIFWIKENQLFTPSLLTGCLNGIARRNILRLATELNYSVKEGLFKVDELQEADVVFSANVTGLKKIISVDNNRVSIELPSHYFLEAVESIFN